MQQTLSYVCCIYAGFEVVLSVASMSMSVSVAIMQLTVSVDIMQLQVSAAHIQMTISATNMYVGDNFYCNYADGGLSAIM